MKRIVVLAVLVALGSASVGSSFAVTVTPTDHLTTLTKDQLTELYYAMLSYYTPDTAMKAVGQVIAIDPRTFEDDGRVKIEDSLEVVIKESKPGEIQPLLPVAFDDFDISWASYIESKGGDALFKGTPASTLSFKWATVFLFQGTPSKAEPSKLVVKLSAQQPLMH